MLEVTGPKYLCPGAFPDANWKVTHLIHHFFIHQQICEVKDVSPFKPVLPHQNLSTTGDTVTGCKLFRQAKWSRMLLWHQLKMKLHKARKPTTKLSPHDQQKLWDGRPMRTPQTSTTRSDSDTTCSRRRCTDVSTISMCLATYSRLASSNALQPASHKYRRSWSLTFLNNNTTNKYRKTKSVKKKTIPTVLWPCVSRHSQLRTGGFCWSKWSKVLLLAGPCWWQLVHSDGSKMAVVIAALCV